MFVFKCDVAQGCPAKCERRAFVMLSENCDPSSRRVVLCNEICKCPYQKPININWEVDA